jgi:hypothetical protein
VFENRVLRRIFGPKRNEVTGGWRKLHNEELRDLYSSPSIIRMIKSRRMRWAGHVARMGITLPYNKLEPPTVRFIRSAILNPACPLFCSAPILG